MKETNNEQQLLREFAEFIEADPVAPGEQLKESVLNLVGKDLHPARGKVYSKFTLVEVRINCRTTIVGAVQVFDLVADEVEIDHAVNFAQQMIFGHQFFDADEFHADLFVVEFS